MPMLASVFLFVVSRFFSYWRVNIYPRGDKPWPLRAGELCSSREGLLEFCPLPCSAEQLTHPHSGINLLLESQQSGEFSSAGVGLTNQRPLGRICSSLRKLVGLRGQATHLKNTAVFTVCLTQSSIHWVDAHRWWHFGAIIVKVMIFHEQSPGE